MTIEVIWKNNIKTFDDCVTYKTNPKSSMINDTRMWAYCKLCTFCCIDTHKDGIGIKVHLTLKHKITLDKTKQEIQNMKEIINLNLGQLNQQRDEIKQLKIENHDLKFECEEYQKVIADKGEEYQKLKNKFFTMKEALEISVKQKFKLKEDIKTLRQKLWNSEKEYHKNTDIDAALTKLLKSDEE